MFKPRHIFTLGRLVPSLIEVSSSSRCQSVPSKLSARLKPMLAECYVVPNNVVTMHGITVPSSCIAAPKECYSKFEYHKQEDRGLVY